MRGQVKTAEADVLVGREVGVGQEDGMLEAMILFQDVMFLFQDVMFRFQDVEWLQETDLGREQDCGCSNAGENLVHLLFKTEFLFFYVSRDCCI